MYICNQKCMIKTDVLLLQEAYVALVEIGDSV